MTVLSSTSDFPAWGLITGAGTPRAFGFEGQQGLGAGAPQDLGRYAPLLEGAREASRAWGPSTKQELQGSLGQTQPGRGGPPGEVWAGCGSREDRTLVAEAPGNTDQQVCSRKSLFWHQDLALSTSLQAPVLEGLRPNNQQERDTAVIRQAT